MNKYLSITLLNNPTGVSHKLVLRMSQAEFNECLVTPDDEKPTCVLRIVQKYILQNAPKHNWVVTSFEEVTISQVQKLLQTTHILVADTIRVRCTATLARSITDQLWNGQIAHPLETVDVEFHMNSIEAEMIGVNREPLDFSLLCKQDKESLLHRIENNFDTKPRKNSVIWSKLGCRQILVDTSYDHWQVLNVSRAKTKFPMLKNTL